MTEFADFVTEKAHSALSNPILRRPATVLIARFAPKAEPAIASNAMLNAEPFASGDTREIMVREWPKANKKLAENDPKCARQNAYYAAFQHSFSEPGLRQFLASVDRNEPEVDVREFPSLTSNLGNLARQFYSPDIRQKIGETWLKAAETQFAKANEPGKAILIDTAFELHNNNKEMNSFAAQFLLVHIRDLEGKNAVKREPLYRDASLVAKRQQNALTEGVFAHLWGTEIDRIKAAEPEDSDLADFLCADAICRGGEESAIGQVAASKTNQRLVAPIRKFGHTVTAYLDTAVLIPNEHLRDNLPRPLHRIPSSRFMNLSDA